MKKPIIRIASASSSVPLTPKGGGDPEWAFQQCFNVLNKYVSPEHGFELTAMAVADIKRLLHERFNGFDHIDSMDQNYVDSAVQTIIDRFMDQE